MPAWGIGVMLEPVDETLSAPSVETRVPRCFAGVASRHSSVHIDDGSATESAWPRCACRAALLGCRDWCLTFIRHPPVSHPRLPGIFGSPVARSSLHASFRGLARVWELDRARVPCSQGLAARDAEPAPRPSTGAVSYGRTGRVRHAPRSGRVPDVCGRRFWRGRRPSLPE